MILFSPSTLPTQMFPFQCCMFSVPSLNKHWVYLVLPVSALGSWGSDHLLSMGSLSGTTPWGNLTPPSPGALSCHILSYSSSLFLLGFWLAWSCASLGHKVPVTLSSWMRYCFMPNFSLFGSWGISSPSSVMMLSFEGRHDTSVSFRAEFALNMLTGCGSLR